MHILRGKSKNITKIYWLYKDIPLRIYMEICASGNVGLMAHNGQVDEQCSVAWEELLRLNAKHNNDLSFMKQVSNLRSFAGLFADYLIIKADLLKVFILFRGAGVVLQQDDELILELGRGGYKIQCDSVGGYAASIERAMHASDAIATQLIMKKNKLTVSKEEQESVTPMGIEEVIANLSYQLGYEVNDNITLSRFNEYKKIVRAKNEARKKSVANGRTNR